MWLCRVDEGCAELMRDMAAHAKLMRFVSC